MGWVGQVWCGVAAVVVVVWLRLGASSRSLVWTNPLSPLLRLACFASYLCPDSRSRIASSPPLLPAVVPKSPKNYHVLPSLLLPLVCAVDVVCHVRGGSRALCIVPFIIHSSSPSSFHSTLQFLAIITFKHASLFSPVSDFVVVVALSQLSHFLGMVRHGRDRPLSSPRAFSRARPLSCMLCV